MKRSIPAVLLVMALALAACDEGESVIFPEPPAGPQGPTGPTGPQGPQGPPGARTVVRDTVYVEKIVYVDRVVTVTLPAQPLNGTCVLDRAKVAHIPESWFNVFHPFDAARLKELCK